MIFRLAFLNCYNLLPFGTQVDRKGVPINQTEAINKIKSLSKTLLSVFPKEIPDLIALSEIGSEPLGRQLAGALGVPWYGLVWSGIPLAAKPQIGIAILYNPNVFGLVPNSLRTGPPALTERRKWLAVRFRLQQNLDAAFWLVANHWKSNMGPPDVVESKQVESAQQIGRLYLREEHKTTKTKLGKGKS